MGRVLKIVASLWLLVSISNADTGYRDSIKEPLAKKQELTRGNGAEPETLDPQKSGSVPSSTVIKDLFEGLITRDTKGGFVGGQAEKWDVSSDGKKYTFYIRKDAYWSNGDKVTAYDFEYAWQRAVDPKTASPYAWFVEITEVLNASDIIASKKSVDTLGAKALDEERFEVNLQRPVPYFIMLLAHPTLYPAHKKTIEKYGDDWTRVGKMVSNGAFKLNQWVVNEKISLVKNDNYWNSKNVILDKITFLPTKDRSDMDRYKAGDLDISTDIPSSMFKSLKKSIPNEVKISPRLASFFYVFNMTDKKFQDVRVRQALSYAIDRDIIVQKVLGLGEKVAYTITPDTVDGFNPPLMPYQKMTQKERDKKAQELLKEAGYDKNNPLEFTYLYPTSGSTKKIAIAIASMWSKKLGVRVGLMNQEYKTFLSNMKKGNFEVGRGGWTGDYNEASTFLEFVASWGYNQAQYKNDGYDSILKKARMATKKDDRNKLYSDAELYLANDMPIIPVYFYVNKRLVKEYVGGYPLNDPEDNVLGKFLYIKKH